MALDEMIRGLSATPGEEAGYQKYCDVDGKIDKKTYVHALREAETETSPDLSKVREPGPDHVKQTRIEQVLGIVNETNRVQEKKGEKGIVLHVHDIQGKLDLRIRLYLVLQDAEHTVSDQYLFAEALRMAGDKESLDKLIAAYPNISF
ncbi:hypothetical protein COU18_03575 [Candidatus Kaiserbacteria bacterium CG10_big_fil_rev_8_21_14_0_10_51_14]|uniref:Uncharacterized protein n=1 Tax=Candidatus Kaiserbacteria bacterium CG10_big_fil_rev_8_21_14_0_10_51_14 TaxID=1974610 RepID=A0A2H0UBG8_9BACT|nr:MAG: hypothetical protein COU18_03575 [Candidatus Kaiserbacteria bacterium CG10_big_fil_rev_8_21_14_0_10_51_14]